MRNPDSTQQVVTVWTFVVTVALLIGSAGIAWGTTQAGIARLREDINDIKAGKRSDADLWRDDISVLATKLQSIDGRLSRIEGKLEGQKP